MGGGEGPGKGREGGKGERRTAASRTGPGGAAGLPPPAPNNFPVQRGFRAPNKGGSRGGARCAQVRPPCPGQGGQRPRRTILPPGPRTPARDPPARLAPRGPAPRRTHRMDVCGATAGTASSSKCMQRTVVRKHRQRLGHPLPGFWATTASTPQQQHITSASRQGRAGRAGCTAMAHGAQDTRTLGPIVRARRVGCRLWTAPSRRPTAAHVPAVRGGRGAPAVHMRAAPPFPPPPPQGPGRGEDLQPCVRLRRPLPRAAWGAVWRPGWAPKFQSQVSAHDLGPKPSLLHVLWPPCPHYARGFLSFYKTRWERRQVPGRIPRAFSVSLSLNLCLLISLCLYPFLSLSLNLSLSLFLFLSLCPPPPPRSPCLSNTQTHSAAGLEPGCRAPRRSP